MEAAQGDGNRKVVRLTDERLRRLERRMEAVEAAIKGTNTRLDQTNTRLDQAIDVLTGLVRVVKAQNDRMNRNFSQLGIRIDRLARSILAGRTADTRRLAGLERRLETLERRL
jgi:ABC-type transporter Mla subunit MlaD